MSNRLEIRGPNGEEIYAAPTSAGWMVVAVAATEAAVDAIVEDLRGFYACNFTTPARTHDKRWAACGRIKTK